jgi:hypothetical protein
MVDRDERLSDRKRDALSRHQADQNAADQARPGGRRYPVKVLG